MEIFTILTAAALSLSAFIIVIMRPVSTAPVSKRSPEKRYADDINYYHHMDAHVGQFWCRYM